MKMKRRLLAAGVAAAVMGVAMAPQAESAPPGASVALFLAGGPVCGFATPPADEGIPDRCDYLLPPPTNPFDPNGSLFRAISAL